MLRRLLILGVLTGLLAGCGPAIAPSATTPTATPTRETIRLPMGYIASVQYAPFYVAAAKGYFAEAGLDIEFDYSFETNGVKLVGANELPFAVVSGEQVLLARGQGLPVVYVMAWFQKFPVAVMAKAETNLTAPGDLKGLTIGTPSLDGANYVGLQALLSYANIQPEEVTVQAIGFNQVPALTDGQVQAVVVYANNEPIRLTAQGEQLKTFLVGDYVTLAANGILTNEDTIAKRPELVRGFVQALTRGLNDTIANPDEAYAIATQYADLQDEAVEKQVLRASIEMWKAPRLGASDPQAWATMQETLLAAGLLSVKQDLDQVFTNEFVP